MQMVSEVREKWVCEVLWLYLGVVSEDTLHLHRQKALPTSSWTFQNYGEAGNEHQKEHLYLLHDQLLLRQTEAYLNYTLQNTICTQKVGNSDSHSNAV